MITQLSYAEILTRAIKSLEQEKQAWVDRAAGKPQLEAILKTTMEPIDHKIQTAKQLYAAETGSKYDG